MAPSHIFARGTARRADKTSSFTTGTPISIGYTRPGDILHMFCWPGGLELSMIGAFPVGP